MYNRVPFSHLAIRLVEDLDFEAWLRPVLYNIGIQGVLFALEQREE